PPRAIAPSAATDRRAGPRAAALSSGNANLERELHQRGPPWVNSFVRVAVVGRKPLDTAAVRADRGAHHATGSSPARGQDLGAERSRSRLDLHLHASGEPMA